MRTWVGAPWVSVEGLEPAQRRRPAHTSSARYLGARSASVAPPPRGPAPAVVPEAPLRRSCASPGARGAGSGGRSSSFILFAVLVPFSDYPECFFPPPPFYYDPHVTDVLQLLGNRELDGHSSSIRSLHVY